ncbi:MAG TPA: sugar phosphate isomerase/epimerase family protein [Thermodesulfobacteriota bacterium]|nr:sugar phosphate isomerase/epimerase family protein [Thermodesulfobacteriota bacterium]HOC37928.1 sugar phosphate isomerase/epimerase family protein [Thermodesulfobacteriota bacterium]
MDSILTSIFVNIPFRMLVDSYLEFCIEKEINPEIGLDAQSLDSCSRTVFAAAATKLQDHGLKMTLHGPFMDLAPGSLDPAVRKVTCQRFEQVLRLLPIFKPVSVVCHAGYDRWRYQANRSLWLEKSLEVWTWMGERVAAEGSCLMLENVYEDGPEDMVDLFESLDRSVVKFCFDTGHQHVFSTAGLDDWITVLGPYLGQLHVHDNTGAHDDHLAIGMGTIDFGLLFQKLKALRPTAPIITLEPHREEDLWPTVDGLSRLWPWPAEGTENRP